MRSRTLITTAILLLTGVLPVSTETESSRFFTEKYVNGRAWISKTAPEKTSYVLGLLDGISVYQQFLRAEFRENYSFYVRELDPAEFNTSELAKQIDAFYRNSADLRIPIPLAFAYVMKRHNGASPTDLQYYLDLLRKAYND